ncbi:MAG: DUF922 domain-containing protein [Bacteroidetes bacterium]|nr:DUF922 domain-containing protein [Bacteroidota bacterium]MBS1929473.1 DUF922 domain-containing protein [Bacteroidota bacterium]
MTILKKISWFTFFVFPLILCAQYTSNDLINWETGRKLNWGNYNGNPDPASDAAASTATYLGVEYSFSNNSFSYKITCSFSRNQSWGRFKTDYILAHEQGHFDITEIFARKLKKALSQYTFNRNTYRKDLDEIYQDITDEKINTQSQYDRETDFSRNKEKQAEWLKKIEKMLDELKKFAGY